MTDSAKSNVLQNAALTVLTSVFLIVVGYELNSWLSRDNLSVDYVRFVPQMQIPTLSGEFQRDSRALKLNSRFERYGNAVGFPFPCTYTLSQRSTEASEYIGQTIQTTKSCLETFVDDNKIDIEVFSEVAAQLDKNPTPAALEMIIQRWSSVFYPLEFKRQSADEELRAAKIQKFKSKKRPVMQWMQSA